MSTTIKETRELIHALSSIAVRTATNLKSGNSISWAEGIGYVAEIGKIKTALAGIKEVPAELADLDADEEKVLREDIRTGLIQIGVTHRIADITEAAFDWVKATLKFVLFVKNAPPTALAV